MKPKPDLEFVADGHPASIWLMRGLSRAGKAWISEHISSEAPRFGSAVAIETRYVWEIIQGADEDGLILSGHANQ